MILLEKNCRESSTKCIKNMNIRYSIAKNIIDDREITVECCSTNDTSEDYNLEINE